MTYSRIYLYQQKKKEKKRALKLYLIEKYTYIQYTYSMSQFLKLNLIYRNYPNTKTQFARFLNNTFNIGSKMKLNCFLNNFKTYVFYYIKHTHTHLHINFNWNLNGKCLLSYLKFRVFYTSEGFIYMWILYI